jgi:hypothetical protein
VIGGEDGGHQASVVVRPGRDLARQLSASARPTVKRFSAILDGPAMHALGIDTTRPRWRQHIPPWSGVWDTPRVTMWIGWDQVSAASLQAFDAHEFEQLVRELLDVECRDRWPAGGTSVEGPSPAHRQDGGRDILVTVSAAPRTDPATYRIRWNVTLVGDTLVDRKRVVSCKTGKTAVKSALDDARDRGDRVLPVLHAGGDLLVVISEELPSAPPRSSRSKAGTPKLQRGDPAAEGSERDRIRQDLARLYAAQFGDDGPSDEDLLPRIDVVDGSELARFLRHRTPSDGLSQQFLDRLGVRRSSALMTHADWEKEHQEDRSRPQYIADKAREAMQEQITDFLTDTSSTTALVVLGPPGVGKTRLVLEALERAGLQTRVHAAENVDVFEEALNGHPFAGAPTGIFVVDDCPFERVEPLAKQFRNVQRDVGTRAAAARFIMIVPRGLTAREGLSGRVVPVVVAPLDAAARAALVRSELGSEDHDPCIARIDATTEGYPWFAILVAREVRNGAATPVSTTDAARLAIASQAQQNVDPECVRRHARALLAIMLADNPDWTAVEDDTRARLAQAVNLRDRHELDALLRACAHRGVLRRTRRWYVTPAILEREVWRILTTPPDGDGHVLPRILRHHPHGVDELFARLEQLGLAPELTRDAFALLDELASTIHHVADLTRPGVGAAVRFCASHLPSETARLLISIVEAATSAELKAERRARRPLVSALLSVARLGAEFEPIESALFRLRLAENEAYANNASAAWVWLFLPWLDMTGTAFPRRLARLTARCTTGDIPERLSAVQGLIDVLSPFTSVFLDGQAEESSPAQTGEPMEAMRCCWALLLDCVGASDPEIADAAQRGFVQHIRPAIDRGILDPLADRVVAAAAGLAEPHRVTLRQDLDLERVATAETAGRSHPLWAQLNAQTRPRSFAQRLRDQLTASPSTAFIEGAPAELADELLLREGLTPPAPPLLEHLAEFEAQSASRAGELMIAAGRLDDTGILEGPLVNHAREGHDAYLLSTYCVGQWNGGRRQRVERWVDTWVREPSLAAAVVEIIARVGPDDPWLEVLGALVARKAVHAEALRYLSMGTWPRTSEQARRAFYRTLLETGRAGTLVVLERMGRSKAGLEPADVGVLMTAVKVACRAPLYGKAAWTFHRCGRLLLDAGLGREVCEAAILATSHEELPGDNVWSLLEDCATTCPGELWRAFEPLLTARDPRAGRLLVRLAWHDVGLKLPSEQVMAWVGTDLRRAVEMAHIMRFTAEDLPALARALLARFGAESAVGREMTASFSTRRPVRSLANFYAEQRARAERWLNADEVEVRAWTTRLLADLAREKADEKADEALARRVGT